MEEKKKEQQREHELQCNGLHYTNCNKCINFILVSLRYKYVQQS